jgi:hypothetical protein
MKKYALFGVVTVVMLVLGQSTFAAADQPAILAGVNETESIQKLDEASLNGVRGMASGAYTFHVSLSISQPEVNWLYSLSQTGPKGTATIQLKDSKGKLLNQKTASLVATGSKTFITSGWRTSGTVDFKQVVNDGEKITVSANASAVYNGLLQMAKGQTSVTYSGSGSKTVTASPVMLPFTNIVLMRPDVNVPISFSLIKK